MAAAAPSIDLDYGSKEEKKHCQRIVRTDDDDGGTKYLIIQHPVV